MSDNNQKNTSTIRIILCVAVLIILFLGKFDIISKMITIPISNILLTIITIWNGVVYYKSGRKRFAVFIFAIAVILIASFILFFVK